MRRPHCCRLVPNVHRSRVALCTLWVISIAVDIATFMARSLAFGSGDAAMAVFKQLLMPSAGNASESSLEQGENGTW